MSRSASQLALVALVAKLAFDESLRGIRNRHYNARSDVPEPEQSSFRKLLHNRSDPAFIDMLSLDVASYERLAVPFRVIFDAEYRSNSGRGPPSKFVADDALGIALCWMHAGENGLLG